MNVVVKDNHHTVSNGIRKRLELSEYYHIAEWNSSTNLVSIKRKLHKRHHFLFGIATIWEISARFNEFVKLLEARQDINPVAPIFELWESLVELAEQNQELDSILKYFSVPVFKFCHWKPYNGTVDESEALKVLFMTLQIQFGRRSTIPEIISEIETQWSGQEQFGDIEKFCQTYDLLRLSDNNKNRSARELVTFKDMLKLKRNSYATAHDSL